MTRFAMKEFDEVSLPSGYTTTYEFSPADAPTTKTTVILVHGFSVPALAWEFIVPILNKAGYPTLRYNLYGRGGSSVGFENYNAQLYVEQLFELIKTLKDEEVIPHEDKFHICGYSMGGGVVASAAAERPEHFKCLGFVCPSGFHTLLGTPRGKKISEFVQSPKFSQIKVGMLLRLVFAFSGVRDWLNKIGNLKFTRDIVRETRRKGYVDAVAKSVFQGPMEGLEAEHKAIKASGLPVFAVWAESDELIEHDVKSDHDNGADSKKSFDRIHGEGKSSVVWEGRHSIAFTHPEEVAGYLMTLFDQNETE